MKGLFGGKDKNFISKENEARPLFEGALEKISQLKHSVESGAPVGGGTPLEHAAYEVLEKENLLLGFSKSTGEKDLYTLLQEHNLFDAVRARLKQKLGEVTTRAVDHGTTLSKREVGKLYKSGNYEIPKDEDMEQLLHGGKVYMVHRKIVHDEPPLGKLTEQPDRSGEFAGRLKVAEQTIRDVQATLQGLHESTKKMSAEEFIDQELAKMGTSWSIDERPELYAPQEHLKSLRRKYSGKSADELIRDHIKMLSAFEQKIEDLRKA